MGIFTNQRSIYNEFGFQEGAFFLNHPVEISLYSVGLWHSPGFFGRSFFPSSGTHMR